VACWTRRKGQIVIEVYNCMTFRYDTSNQWFKGNTHIHSTVSDGGKSFGELAEMYASVGYDFLFRTDHWVASDTAQDIFSQRTLE
jgi:hypothetical protein